MDAGILLKNRSSTAQTVKLSTLQIKLENIDVATIGVILMLPVIGLVCWLLYGGILWVLGYQLGLAPWELAQKLVTEGKPAHDCYL